MTHEEHISPHEEEIGLLDYLGLVFQNGSNADLKNYIYTEQNSDFEVVFYDYFFPSNSILSDLFSSSLRIQFKTREKLLIDFRTTSVNGLRAPPNRDYYL